MARLWRYLTSLVPALPHRVWLAVETGDVAEDADTVNLGDRGAHLPRHRLHPGLASIKRRK